MGHDIENLLSKPVIWPRKLSYEDGRGMCNLKKYIRYDNVIFVFNNNENKQSVCLWEVNLDKNLTGESWICFKSENTAVNIE